MQNFEAIKDAILYYVVGRLPAGLWSALTNIDLIIPYWHVVSDADLPHISGMYKWRSPKQFLKDIEHLLAYYEPVSLEQIIKKVYGGKKFKKPSFIATFDDGFREIYEIIAPILFKKGVPAVFFLTTEAIDNQMLLYPQKKSLLLNTLGSLDYKSMGKKLSDWVNKKNYGKRDPLSLVRDVSYRDRSILDEMAALLHIDFKGYLEVNKPYLTSEQVTALIEQGFDIGAHSLDHPRFSEISLEEQLYQTIQSAYFISSNFEYSCKTFAFPFSDAGISADYFERIFKESSIIITFGTSGLMKAGHTMNLPRFSMEKTDAAARQIIARQCARLLFHRTVRKL